MSLSTAISLLRMLGTRPRDALTAKEILAKWTQSQTAPLTLRTVQRYLSLMSAEGADGIGLVHVDADVKERRYHLRLSEMANWFMTEEAALYQLLSLQVLQSTFGDAASTAIERQLDAARYLTQEQIRTKRLRERVRIVPDGIGRLRAKVQPETLGSVMDALAGDQRIEIDYLSAAGKSSLRELVPLGLVAKDGTLYLIAVSGLTDSPIHYPLHRMKSAWVKPLRAQSRDDFQIDAYIRESHQLSHVLSEQPQAGGIRIKVHPNWLYHFEERPLSEDQTITKPRNEGEWAELTAGIPLTHLLQPFLASMGPGIEVIEPESLRLSLSKWLSEAAALYQASFK